MNMHPLILALGFGVGAALSTLIALDPVSPASVSFQGWLGTGAAFFFAFWGKLTHPTKLGRLSDSELADRGRL